MQFIKKLFRTLKTAKRAMNFNFNQVGNSWNPQLLPPDAAIRDNHEKLIARCRNICDEDSYGAGIVTTFHENVVTSGGIQIQNTSEDQEFAKAVDAAWKKFSRDRASSLSADMNLIDLQKQAVTGYLSDGEVFVRKHITRDGFKYELIDPPRIPYGLLTRAKTVNRYRNGIYVNDDTGRVLGYRINDKAVDSYRLGVSVSENNGTLVGADEIIHSALRKRTDQIRGVPLLKSVAGRIYKISEYENATLDHAISAAKKYGWFVWQKDAEAPPDLELSFQPSKEKSGSFHELPAGMNVESWQSQFPDGELGSFIQAILLAVSRAIGVSYPTLSGNLEHVNYASIRQACLAERAVWNSFQMFLFLELLFPIYEAFFTDLLASGGLLVRGQSVGLDRFDEVMKVAIASTQFSEIDPKAENIVETARIQNLVVAPSEVIRMRGGDPEETWSRIAKDIKAMMDAGIPAVFVNDLYLRQPAAVIELENAGLLPGNAEVENGG